MLPKLFQQKFNLIVQSRMVTSSSLAPLQTLLYKAPEQISLYYSTISQASKRILNPPDSSEIEVPTSHGISSIKRPDPTARQHPCPPASMHQAIETNRSTTCLPCATGFEEPSAGLLTADSKRESQGVQGPCIEKYRHAHSKHTINASMV